MHGGEQDADDQGWAIERVARRFEDHLKQQQRHTNNAAGAATDESHSTGPHSTGPLSIKPLSIEQLLDSHPELPQWELLSALIETELDVLEADNARESSYALRFPEFARSIDELLSKPQPPAPRILNAGDTVGKYRIEALVGCGAVAHVYKAAHCETGVTVAIKVLRSDWQSACEPDCDQRFKLEGEFASRLKHSAIVPFVESGEHDGLHFHVFQYVNGVTLRDYSRHKILSPVEASRIIAQVADAIHFSHRLGIVHRDLKPGNILLSNEGRVYVTDFGIALDQSHQGPAVSFVGTPLYMSPEQARGMSHRLDGRADVFALGVILYELTTGTHPFGSHDIPVEELVRWVEAIDAPPLRQRVDVPVEFERICLKSLSRDAADRYSTAEDLARALRRFVFRARTARPLVLTSVLTLLLCILLPVSTLWMNRSTSISGLTGQPQTSQPTAANSQQTDNDTNIDNVDTNTSHESSKSDATQNLPSSVLSTALSTLLPEGVAKASEEEIASAAALIIQQLKTNQDVDSTLWEYFKSGEDNTLQSLLIERCAEAEVPFEQLTQQLIKESSSDVRFAILMAMGQYGPGQISHSDRESMIRYTLQLFTQDNDPGIHGASSWLLRAWGATAELEQQRRELQASQATVGRHWEEAFGDLTMIQLPDPRNRLLGSGPETGSGYNSAIAAYEISRGQWNRVFGAEMDTDADRDPSLPKNDVTWHKAAEFCNRLSQLSGLAESELCYRTIDAAAEGSNYIECPDIEVRTGFRLPTIEEWTAACRAGSMTRRYWGRSENLAARYANYRRAGSRWWQPMVSGTLKPNRLGLFDSLGNLSEWMHLRTPYGAQSGATSTDVLREIRGGSAWTASTGLNVDSEYNLPEQAQFDRIGIRVARTIAPAYRSTPGLELVLLDRKQSSGLQRQTITDRSQPASFSLGRISRGGAIVFQLAVKNGYSRPLTITRGTLGSAPLRSSDDGTATGTLPMTLEPGATASLSWSLPNDLQGYQEITGRIDWQLDREELWQSELVVAAYFVGPALALMTLPTDHTGGTRFEVGTLPLGSTFSHPLVLRNWGDQPVKIANATIDAPFRIESQSPTGVLRELEFGSIDVGIDTSIPGEFTGRLRLETSDPVTPDICIEYHAHVAELEKFPILGVYRRGLWLLDTNRDGQADHSFQFGSEMAQPLTGDFDGDGLVDFAVVGPISNGKLQVTIRNAKTLRAAEDVIRTLELPDSSDASSVTIGPFPQMIAADIDRDGRCDLGVVCKRAGKMQILVECNGDQQFDETIQIDRSCDRVLLKDWDGDGQLEQITVSLNKKEALMIWDTTSMDGSPIQQWRFGLSGDEPIVADWNGDGQCEPTIYRSSHGPVGFYIDWNATPETDQLIPIGQRGDHPVSFVGTAELLRHLPRP